MSQFVRFLQDFSSFPDTLHPMVHSSPLNSNLCFLPKSFKSTAFLYGAGLFCRDRTKYFWTFVFRKPPLVLKKKAGLNCAGSTVFHLWKDDWPLSQNFYCLYGSHHFTQNLHVYTCTRTAGSASYTCHLSLLALFLCLCCLEASQYKAVHLLKAAWGRTFQKACSLANHR